MAQTAFACLGLLPPSVNDGLRRSAQPTVACWGGYFAGFHPTPHKELSSLTSMCLVKYTQTVAFLIKKLSIVVGIAAGRTRPAEALRGCAPAYPVQGEVTCVSKSEGLSIPHPTSSYAPFTQGSLSSLPRFDAFSPFANFLFYRSMRS